MKKSTAAVTALAFALAVMGVKQAEAQSVDLSQNMNRLCKPGDTTSIQFGYTVSYGDRQQPVVSYIYPECCPKGNTGILACPDKVDGKGNYVGGFRLSDNSSSTVLLHTPASSTGAATSAGGTVTGTMSTFTLPSTNPASYTLDLTGFCYMGATDSKGQRIYTSGFRIEHGINISVSVNNPGC